AAAEFRPEIVLLDIGMPKLDGYETCRQIRGQPWGKDMFLVALTGWGQDGDRRRADEAGFDRHLVKPVDPGALMTLLAALPPGPAKPRRGPTGPDPGPIPNDKEHPMNLLRALGLALRRLPRAVRAAAFSSLALALPAAAFASELDLELPVLDTQYQLFGMAISGRTLLLLGLGVCVLGGLFGLAMYRQVKALPAHKSMLDVSNIIWETC